MKPFVDRQRKYFEAQKAAREERAAEERNFMKNFNPNTAERKDFTRFRENLKEQALKLANARPDGGIMGAKNAEIFHSLYSDPYRKMMGQYMKTNPEDYQENFPYSFAIQRAIPMAVKGAMGVASGIPFLGKMLPEQTNELLGDLSYLDYRPTRLGTPKGEVLREAYTSAGGFEYPEVVSTGAMEDYYDEYFPMQLPDYFYQFMDDEMLPYILGMR